MKYLVDTNVLSELRKGARCDSRVARWFADVSDQQIFVSVLTVGEIRKGIESIRRRDAGAAVVLERWLQRVVAEHADRILVVDDDIAQEWGRMNVPDSLPTIDGLIGATAKVHGLTVATRNTGDLARSGANLINPFEQGGVTANADWTS